MSTSKSMIKIESDMSINVNASETDRGMIRGTLNITLIYFKICFSPYFSIR